jgi:hypothetical protein
VLPLDGGANDGPAFVQSAAVGDNDGGTSITLDIAPTRAGDVMVVALGAGDAAFSVTTIQDDGPGGGNAYRSANERSHDTTFYAAEIWFATNLRPGATKVTITLAFPARLFGWVMEFSGLSPTDPLDRGAATNDGPDASLVVAPPVTPSVANAVIVSVAMSGGAIVSLDARSPFVALPVLHGNSAAYYVAQTLGTYGAVWESTPASWNASTVCFK